MNKNNNYKRGFSTVKNKKSPLYSSLLISGTLVLLTGCNNSLGDLDEYFVTQRERVAAPISPIPEVKPYLRYVYPEHEKDPFDVAMLTPEAGEKRVIDNGIEVDTTRVPEFLEGFPLDSLRMVGTVEKDKTLWALIRIPDGAVQSVKQGNYMGQNYGKIVSITDATMEMKETVSNGLGGYKERETSIVLSQE